MSSRYLEMIRGQRRRPSGFQFTSKSLLACLALTAMAGSAVYWWGVQSQLTENRIVALAYTAILVLAPPSLVSFLIPWSPGGMLLQKVNARTWGYLVVVGCSLYLLYYSFQIRGDNIFSGKIPAKDQRAILALECAKLRSFSSPYGFLHAGTAAPRPRISVRESGIN